MISRKITQNMAAGSMIRKMFEEGARLKAQFGADKVYDFSIGNPDLEPPAEVLAAFQELSADPRPGLHAYMSNAGYLETRQVVADKLSLSSGLAVKAEAVCMTVGAAGALNVSLKALLDPGDEVIVLAPYFVEYLSYIQNHGGVPVIVHCNETTFFPDPERIAAALTPRTKALIINSPNNPTGVIYPIDVLKALDKVLLSASQTVYVLSDEPYAGLTFDGQKTPDNLAHLTNCIVCNSWSKSLSLPGERIGYIGVSPRCEDYSNLVQAIGYCNRVLGFVNAPAFLQRVIAKTIDARVDVNRYETRRNRMHEILTSAGFDVRRPDGGFYFFPKAPIADDSEFVAACAKHNVLVVPGKGFGFPGFFRLCFAVPDDMIERSAPAWLEIGKEFGLV
ncbi:MAG: pyridoxal phosphate-dependent aminotransferase [Clostridia bacterium]|nr:pyridoxal phosphate-dependent aminotransferase [Clostridia bacterium]